MYPWEPLRAHARRRPELIRQALRRVERSSSLAAPTRLCATVTSGRRPGYELPARRGGLTWRAGVDLWSQGHGDRTVFANGTPVETLDRSGRSWAYGASLYGSWGPSVEVTRIRPYLLGGAGVHRFTTVQRVSPGAGSRTSFTADIDAARTSLSVTGGAGLQADVGRVTMFTEVRYMRLLGTEVGRSGSPLVRNWLMPLTVGVRLP